MPPAPTPAQRPDAAFDGGDLDCGGGLLLLLRQHLDPLPRGGLLELRSRETSVDEDLPAWCRLTGNELVSVSREGSTRSFLICKGSLAERAATAAATPATAGAVRPSAGGAGPVRLLALPRPAPAAALPRLAVMGIGSWPRPRWLLEALHARLEGRLSEEAFAVTADDAVRLCVAAQERAGVDVVSDGEQRRDSYANFVGGRLSGAGLVPLTDLLPLVDHPETLREQFRSLDVPAEAVRHPLVVGRLSRAQPIAGHELAFVRTLTSRPVKVALPGPYLLSRVMWLECLAEGAYATREDLADDLVTLLREEVHELLAAGAALVQLDEPVLTEVVHGRAVGGRSFMCGALSEKGAAGEELERAVGWINRVVAGLPRERVAVHLCRGNWTPDESAALAGDYRPLVPTLARLEVGAYLLEACTPRAGELEVLRGLPEDRRIGIGAVNPKQPRVETVEEILARARQAIDLFGRERVLLHPDCGFATFADNPVASAAAAEGKLTALVEAARRLR